MGSRPKALRVDFIMKDFYKKRIGHSYSQPYNHHMQKTFSPQGWLLAALISAGLWIGYANEPTRPSGGISQVERASNAPEFLVAAKEEKKVGASLLEKLVPLPPVAKYIPADATVILSARLGDLLKKGGYAEFMKSDMFQALKDGIENETAQKIMENPAASGIDINQPIYIYMNFGAPDEEFGQPTITGGLIAAVKDAKALDKALDLATAQTGLPLNKTAEKGFTQLFMQGMPAAVGYSKEVMIAVGTNDPEQLPNMTKNLAGRMSGKGNLKDKRITSLLRNKYDIAGWMDYSRFMKFAMGMIPEAGEGAPFGLDFAEKFSKDQAYAMRVNFEAGKVTMDLNYYYDQKLFKGNFSKGGLDKGLLNLIPADSIMVFAEAMNMEPVREMMKEHIMPLLEEDELAEVVGQAEEMIGLSVDELMSIPKGDFLAVWEGLDMVEGDFGPQPSPKLILGMTVENRKNLNKLMNNPQLQGMLPLLATVGLQIAQSEKGFFICSPDHAAAINEGKAKKPFKGAHKDLIAKNDYAGYFRFAPLVKVIQKFAGEDPQAQQVIGELKRLDEASFSGDLNPGSQKSNMALKFKDAKTNSLTQLIETGQRLFEIISNSGIGIDFEDLAEPALELDK